MNDKIQLTEEEFDELFEIFWNAESIRSDYTSCKAISKQEAKEAGYIKKPKLEEAREYAEIELESDIVRPDSYMRTEKVYGYREMLKEKYEQAIEEITGVE